MKKAKKNVRQVASFRRAQEKKDRDRLLQVIAENKIVGPETLKQILAKAKERELFLQSMTHAFEEETGGALFSEAMMRAILCQRKHFREEIERLNELVAAQAKQIVALGERED